MSLLSPREAAALLGISRQRLHQLITDGQLPAQRVGRTWVLSRDDVDAMRVAPRAAVRPMSPRMARAMVDLIGHHLGIAHGPAWAAVSHRERSRLRKQLRRLLAEEDPGTLMRAWLPQRCQTERFAFAGPPHEIFTDPRLSAGGAAHPELGLSAGPVAEPHVADTDRKAVIQDLLLVPDVYGNVLLRSEPVVRVDLAGCLADIADLGGGRNSSTVKNVLHQGG